MLGRQALAVSIYNITLSSFMPTQGEGANICPHHYSCYEWVCSALLCVLVLFTDFVEADPLPSIVAKQGR